MKKENYGKGVQKLIIRKNSRGFTIIFLLILFISFGLFLAGYFLADARMYQENWNITIPDDWKKQYYTSSFGGGARDGESYAIYTLKDKHAQGDTSFLEGTSSQKNTQMQAEVIAILKRLKVDTQKYPNFSHHYQWKILYKSGSDTLYILYDTEASLVYFIQNIF